MKSQLYAWQNPSFQNIRFGLRSLVIPSSVCSWKFYLTEKSQLDWTLLPKNFEKTYICRKSQLVGARLPITPKKWKILHRLEKVSTCNKNPLVTWNPSPWQVAVPKKTLKKHISCRQILVDKDYSINNVEKLLYKGGLMEPLLYTVKTQIDYVINYDY